MKYENWIPRNTDEQAIRELRTAGYGRLASHVLAARGFYTPQEADAFLSGSPDRLFPPAMLLDMDKAVARIEKALARHEHITVYGDYDVDGITATCLLIHWLSERGAAVDYYIPNRLTEGYGLKADVLQKLRDAGTTLVITVDTGTVAVEEAAAAATIGLDLVITDHHQCRESLPYACAVVNPCRHDQDLPFAALAGVGVAFKLICALDDRPSAELLARYGDLVALGTVADVMPLIADNRVFVRHGLTLMEYTENKGLSALMRAAELPRRKPTATALSFGLIPRLNAAGRLGQADLAAELLLTKDTDRAARLADQLCQLNRQRGALESEMLSQAVEMLDDAALPPVLTLAHPKWPLGVLGIVAARLASRYHRPVFLISLRDGMGQGSARSAGGVPLVRALTHTSELLDHFGGHEAAAGFALREENIPAFRDALNDFVSRHTDEWSPPALELDVNLPPDAFTQEELNALALLEPFGSGHKAPVFWLENVELRTVTPMGGGRHLRLTFADHDRAFEAVFFGVDALALGFLPGDLCDIAFHAELNEFRGRQTVQFQLVDIRLAAVPQSEQDSDFALFEMLMREENLTPTERACLLPDRDHLGELWRFLRKAAHEPYTAHGAALTRQLFRFSEGRLTPARTLVGLEVFCELNLLRRFTSGDEITLEIAEAASKVDLEHSEVLRRLRTPAADESSMNDQ